jgi:hypothetical protein
MRVCNHGTKPRLLRKNQMSLVIVTPAVVVLVEAPGRSVKGILVKGFGWK